MNIKSRYKVLIVGAGNIGALLDTPQSSEVLTHAHACYLIKEFSDFSFVELQTSNAKEAAAIWNKKVFSNLSEGLNEFRPNIVSVCVPTKFRKEVVEALPSTLSFLFLEKPLGSDLENAKEVVSFVSSNNIPAAVNYSRLYSNDILNLKDKIVTNSFGALIKGVFTYSKGLRNNGSHLLRLATFLFGGISKHTVLGTSIDYSQTDINVDLKLEFKDHGPVFVLALDEKKFSNIECHLYFEKTRIVLKQFGHLLQISTVREDPIYKDYRDFDESTPFRNTDLGQTMLLAYKNILNHLTKNVPIHSGIQEALEVEILLEKILIGI